MTDFLLLLKPSVSRAVEFLERRFSAFQGLCLHRTAQEIKRGHTIMPEVGFETTTLVFGRPVHTATATCSKQHHSDASEDKWFM